MDFNSRLTIAFASAGGIRIGASATPRGQILRQQPSTSSRRNALLVTMLRVQRKRRPEDWEKRNSGLSGRFLPMDPRDEAILDILGGISQHGEDGEESYGPEGPPSEAYGQTPASGEQRKWSKRSEAARKRWADPEYRAKMLQKRAEKRRRDSDAASIPKIEIGVMDSITLADEPRAKAINAYARSNKLRSEKITAFHKDRKLWMENRLKDSPKHLSEYEKLQKKIQLKEKRRQTALQRARNKQRNNQASDLELRSEDEGDGEDGTEHGKRTAARTNDL